MSEAAQRWIGIGQVDDIAVRAARIVKTPKGCIAVFRTAADQVYAMLDRCPHNGGPLSQGIVHGTSVTCPLHNWVIDLTTGEALGADKGSVPIVLTKIEDGHIYLDVTTVPS